MLRRRWKIWTWAAAVLCFLGSQPSSACTLWGASGTAVEGGGTLVAKNRDWSPDHRQELSVLRPAQGYRSLVLKAVGGGGRIPLNSALCR